MSILFILISSKIIITIVLLLDWSIIPVLAALTVKVSDAVALVGQPFLQLNCSSNLTEPDMYINWHFKSTRQGATFNPIVLGKFVVDGFNRTGRYSRSLTGNGQQNLIIRNISLDDAGTYRCWDDGGLMSAEWSKADLVVLSSSLDCTHNISNQGVFSGDICGIGIQPDNISITCQLIFKGNSSILLMRIKTGNIVFRCSSNNKGDFNPLETSVIEVNSVIVGSVVQKVLNEMDGSYITCEALGLQADSLGALELNASWASRRIQITKLSIDTFRIASNQGRVCQAQDLKCSAPIHTNIESCSCKWTTSHRTLYTDVIFKATMVNESYGWFNCTVECNIGGHGTCRIRTYSVLYTDCQHHLLEEVANTRTVSEDNYKATVAMKATTKSYKTIIATVAATQSKSSKEGYNDEQHGAAKTQTAQEVISADSDSDSSKLKVFVSTGFSIVGFFITLTVVFGICTHRYSIASLCQRRGRLTQRQKCLIPLTPIGGQTSQL